MKEVPLPDSRRSLDTRSFLACIATVLEVPVDRLPEPEPDADPASGWVISRWLGGLGLGLAPIADAASFAWPGPWIARIRPLDGSERRSVVMFGVPSGVVFDPTGVAAADGWSIADAFLVAPCDVALAAPQPPASAAAVGAVVAIWVAVSAGALARAVESVRAVPGRGLDGDRYHAGTGTFPSGAPGSALTLIASEVCDSFDPPLAPDEHRRNIVTRGVDLNALVGREFSLGGVRCRGMRLCEPCRVVEGYASRPILRALVHRGGLRADILTTGTVNLGDRVAASEGEPATPEQGRAPAAGG